jgi:hypothetical protein
MTHVTMALLLLALGAADGGVLVSSWATPARAWAAIDLTHTDVLAVGEYHETSDAPRVPSALKRFTRTLLPALVASGHAPRSVIAETWMVSGRCGEVERQATSAVEETTNRPQSTEDELTSLLDRTYALGAKNHILIIGCDDYRSMLDDAGALDAEASLRLVRRKVEAKALELRDAAEGGVEGKLLLLYGGALHNDVAPAPTWAPYSFGPALVEATGGRYTEVDLLVPEYVEGDDDLRREAFFAPAMALAKKGQTVLIHPRPSVYLLLFAMTPKAKR